MLSTNILHLLTSKVGNIFIPSLLWTGAGNQMVTLPLERRKIRSIDRFLAVKEIGSWRQAGRVLELEAI